MGLLSVPKTYKPRKGAPKEDLIYASKAEQGLLKSLGGSGKKTKHGIPSYWLGDKGNAVGSAGASNYAGNGRGGQVNLGNVGGKTGNVLRNIGGEWTVVSKATGAQIDAGKAAAPIRTKPAPVAAPVTRTVTTPALPSGFMGPGTALQRLGPQIGGTTAAAMKAAIARAAPGFAGPASSMSMANPGPQIGGTLSRATVGMDRGNVTSTTNQTPALGLSGGRTGFSGVPSFDKSSAYGNDRYGASFAPSVSSQPSGFSGGRTGFSGAPGTTTAQTFSGGRTGFSGAPPAPQSVTDPYGGMGKMGLNSGQTSPYNQPGGAITDPYGGMGKMGMRSGQTSPFNQPAQAVTDPYGGMGKMGMRSGQTSPFNQPAAPSQTFQSNLGYQDPQALRERALAVSRGPGTLSGALPGSTAAAQNQTANALSNAINDKMGLNTTPSQIGMMARTSAGETASESPFGQTAAMNTMINRMELGKDDPDTYGYLGGGNVDQMLAGYDANGIRPGTTPNAVFRGTVPGTENFRNGLNSIAGALSPVSNFNQTAPAALKNATHYFNRDVANPKWGRNFNTQVGAHTFGNAEPTATQVAALRGTTPPTSGPTMVAGIDPAVAPPQAQTPSQPASSWFSGLPGAGMVQDAIASVNENLVQPTQEQIQKYGGFERAGRLARTAVGIMNSLKSTGNPVRTGAGGDSRTDHSQNGGRNLPSERLHKERGGKKNKSVPEAPASFYGIPPTIFPQYTSGAWANLPAGRWA